LTQIFSGKAVFHSAIWGVMHLEYNGRSAVHQTVILVMLRITIVIVIVKVIFKTYFNLMMSIASGVNLS